MKRIILTLMLACISVFAFAQKSSLLRPRMEIAEITKEEKTRLEIFYMNDESPRMYYLSLGNLGVGSDYVQLEIDPATELFLPLGGTVDEAIDRMEQLISLYKMDNMESTEVDGYFSLLYPTGDLMPVKVTYTKLLLSNVLAFSIPTEIQDVVRATYVHRSDMRSILSSLKFYKKLYPKN
ncbi:MAG: hypothetical protein J6W09_06155 [Bacteroidales bacterium]|nr:hypothetical protein [Bacteroidales bacterium]